MATHDESLPGGPRMDDIIMAHVGTTDQSPIYRAKVVVLRVLDFDVEFIEGPRDGERVTVDKGETQ